VNRRLTLGIITRFPRLEQGYWDLLILPQAEKTVGDIALTRIICDQYRRILSFSRSRWTRDAELNLRLQYVTGSIWPVEREPVPVTAVILATRGTKPENMADPFEQKRELYWNNKRRNQRIREIARQLVSGTLKSIRSVLPNNELAQEALAACKKGVAILVETPVHARELAKRLSGWVIWMGESLEYPPRPNPGCGIIITERGAKAFIIQAGVLIRATGTPWPLPNIDWPWPGEVAQGILVDLGDDFHPVARRYAISRQNHYEQAGMSLYTLVPASAGVHNKTTEAPPRPSME
jgi:hypothetical protein